MLVLKVGILWPAPSLRWWFILPQAQGANHVGYALKPDIPIMVCRYGRWWSGLG